MHFHKGVLMHFERKNIVMEAREKSKTTHICCRIYKSWENITKSQRNYLDYSGTDLHFSWIGFYSLKNYPESHVKFSFSSSGFMRSGVTRVLSVLKHLTSWFYFMIPS